MSHSTNPKKSTATVASKAHQNNNNGDDAPTATTGAAVPGLRTGGKPNCGHFQCTWKFNAMARKQQQQGTNNDDDDSVENSKKKNVPSTWLGPCGVVTIFYRRIGNFTSPNGNNNTASSTNSSSVKPQPDVKIGVVPSIEPYLIPPATSAQNITTNNDSKSGIAFLIGFDMYKGKYSACSGTMSDSWRHDRGCAVLAGIRESKEEFKFDFKNLHEYLQMNLTEAENHKSGLWWWEGSTVCFAINLDALPDTDPRKDFAKLQKSVQTAYGDKTLPMCEREISSLQWFVVCDDVVRAAREKRPEFFYSTQRSSGADPIFGKEVAAKLVNSLTGFGALCICKATRKIIAATSSAAPLPPVVKKKEEEAGTEKTATQ